MEETNIHIQEVQRTLSKMNSEPHTETQYGRTSRRQRGGLKKTEGECHPMKGSSERSPTGFSSGPLRQNAAG